MVEAEAVAPAKEEEVDEEVEEVVVAAVGRVGQKANRFDPAIRGRSSRWLHATGWSRVHNSSSPNSAFNYRSVLDEC